METVTVSSKGQITIPSKLRRKLGMVKGEKLMIVREGDAIKLIPVPKLSKLAGVDKDLFKDRKPSEDIEDIRRRWDEEFETRVKQT